MAIAESQAENRLSLLLAFPLVKKFSSFSRLDTDYADFVPETNKRGFLKHETILEDCRCAIATVEPCTLRLAIRCFAIAVPSQAFVRWLAFRFLLACRDDFCRSSNIPTTASSGLPLRWKNMSR